MLSNNEGKVLTSGHSEDENLKVQNFSLGILNSNERRFKEGDNIGFFRGVQKFNSNLEIPYVEFTTSVIKLDMLDDKPLFDCVHEDGFELVDGYLAAKVEPNTMITWLLTREDRDGRIHTTNQNLIGENELLEYFSSDRAFWAAVDSYGGINKEQYLNPATNQTFNYNYTIEDFEDFTYPDLGQGGTNTGSGTGNTDPTNSSNPGTNPSNPGSTPSTPSTPSGNIEISVAISPSADMGHVEGAGSYAEGEQVTLKAIPNSGYRFVWWQDNHDQNATRTITVGSENQTYTAIFGEII